MNSPKKPRALLAEDHPILRDLYGASLEALGFTCVRTAHGTEAFAAFEAARFDLLVTDHEMPEMTGLELIRRVRAFERKNTLPRVPIVVITAGHGKVLQELKDAGADEVLTKLCVPSQLGERLIRLGLVSPPSRRRHSRS